MKFTAVMSRVGAGAAAVALLVFAGSAPAGAATEDTLYTATFFDASQGSIGTIDLDGPTFTTLGTDLPAPYLANGIDVFDGTGYGIALNDDDGQYYVFTWDTATGTITAPVLITQAIDPLLDITSVRAADTLADGTLITFLLLSDGTTSSEFVVSINPLTGAATELVDITGAAGFLDGLATDPTTGKTYAFVDEDLGMPQYLELDLVGGTYTGPTDLTGIHDSFGDGYLVDGDFNAAGFLYFYYIVTDNASALLAGASGAFSATVGADFAGGGAVSGDVDVTNLTVDSALVKPALANTGLPIPGMLVGGVALLGAGLAAVYITRRRASA